jgi:hypothetical protein
VALDPELESTYSCFRTRHPLCSIYNTIHTQFNLYVSPASLTTVESCCRRSLWNIFRRGLCNVISVDIVAAADFVIFFFSTHDRTKDQTELTSWSAATTAAAAAATICRQQLSDSTVAFPVILSSACSAAHSVSLRILPTDCMYSLASCGRASKLPIARSK